MFTCVSWGFQAQAGGFLHAGKNFTSESLSLGILSHSHLILCMTLGIVECGCGGAGELWTKMSKDPQGVLSPLPPTDPSQRVLEVSNHWWYSMLIQPPLLKDSVAAPLLSAYYPDCVGMSPSCTSTHRAAVTATATGSASPGEMEPSKAAPASLGERCSGPFSFRPLPLLGG